MVRLSAGAVALGLILGAVPLRARAGEGDREVTRLAIDEAPDVFVWRGTMSVDDAWRGHLEVRFWKRTSGGEADTWEVRERFDATGARGGLAERGVDSRLDASLLPLRARLWQEPGGGRATLDTDASGTRVHSLRGESKHLPPSERYPIHNVGTAVLYSLGRPDSPLPGGLHFRALSLEDGGVAPANFQQFGLGRGGKDARVRAMGVEGGISYDVIERLHHGGVVSIMVDRGFGHIARDPALALETWPRGEAPDPRSRRAAVAARLSLLLVTGAVSEIAPLLDAKEICRRQGVPNEASLPDALREIGLRHRALFEGEVDGELRASVLAELSADASADGDAGPETGFELGGGLRCVVADGPRGAVVVDLLDAERRCLDTRYPCDTPYVAATRWRLGLAWGRADLVDDASDWAAISEGAPATERGDAAATRAAALKHLLRGPGTLEDTVEVHRAFLTSLARGYERVRISGPDRAELLSGSTALRLRRDGARWRVIEMPSTRIPLGK